MKGAVLALVVVITPLAPCESCFGQDVLGPHKIKGLKGLRNVAIVLRMNTPREFASQKEWGDFVEVGLRHEVPDLGREKTDRAQAWLELSVVTTDQGAQLELSVYRWVKVLDSGEALLSKVWWDSRGLFGDGVSKSALRDSLNELLTSFAADYSRAKN